MIDKLNTGENKIAVIGLGYVGLPIALEFGRKFKTIGFDINEQRVEMMNNHQDPSQELDSSEFKGSDIIFSAKPTDLESANFFVVAVPTPVDEHKVPNLRPLISASKTVGKALKKGDYVVFESTVYPGCTEEDCIPILEAESGLKAGVDFKYGYSPERINPGDKERTVTTILKIVSGNDAESLDVIAAVYGAIITAGVYKAATVKVAEAAKVIENTQRDLNISFVNELAIIFDKMGINTKDVLDAAGTKWNFLKFSPGLVGGHCIGVDPYYLLHKSKQLGIDPQVILSGRRINDGMPAFIAKRLIQMLIQKGKSPQNAKVLVKGMTFKEDVSDIRNSKVVDLINELMDYSVNVHVIDVNASPNEVAHEYKLTLIDKPSSDYDAVIVAVGHEAYKGLSEQDFADLMAEDAVLMDLKSLYINLKDSSKFSYWSL